MKTVVITAGNSFIGYRLCVKMAKNGWRVYAVVRSNNKNTKILEKYGNIIIIYQEMKNYAALSEYIVEECDVGVMLAWDGTRGSERNEAERQKNNYVYSMECAKSLLEMKCKIIVTAGSQAEYGSWKNEEKVKETECCNPNTEYGIYKLKLYQDILKLCEDKGVRVIEPRFFSLYGPDDFEGTMVISVINNMLRNQPCELTKCIQRWDFLYIDDAVDALYKLINIKTAKGVYNFGSGISNELKEYVMLMYKLTNSKSELLFGKIPYPQTGIVNTNPSIEKLKNEIDWEPMVTFEDGIKKVIVAQQARLVYLEKE